MNRIVRVVLIAAASLSVLPAAARAATPTVYASLPFTGFDHSTVLAIDRGARLALKEAGNPFRYELLDEATRKTGSWTPNRVSANARHAAADPGTLGVIGAYTSGAGAIAVPILNAAGVPVISPSSTATGLTIGGPGDSAGEPDKYYPTGTRTLFRLSPNDDVQAGALVAAMANHACPSFASLSDQELYGTGLAQRVRAYAAGRGIKLVATRRLHRQRNYRALGRTLHAKHAACVVYTGVTANGAVALFRDVGRALPKARLFGSDGMAENGFSRHIPRGVARRTHITVSTLAPSAYPAAGQQVIKRYGGDPYAAYGYEAMRLYIDAFRAAGPDKAAITTWLHTVQNRAGAIGTYGFNAFGDTTLRTYGLYAIRGGYLTWQRAVSG